MTKVLNNEQGGGKRKPIRSDLNIFLGAGIQVDAKISLAGNGNGKIVVDNYVSDLRIVQMVRTNTQGASGS